MQQSQEIMAILLKCVGKAGDTSHLSESELASLQEWLKEERNQQHYDSLQSSDEVDRFYAQMVNAETELAKRINLLHRSKSKTFYIRRWSTVAACFAIVISVATWMFWKTDSKNKAIIAQTVTDKQPIPPGSDRAVLILPDGSTIQLDTLSQGGLINVKGVAISNQQDALVYGKGGAPTGPVQYHTIRIPKAGQYKIQLEDGTRIVLNAESVLKYPTHFSGNIRQVELQGQGFFEVSHNGKPFVVKSETPTHEQMEVRVLGTQFVVTAYPEKPTVRTALLEGKVEIAYGGDTQLLSPGQQSTVGSSAQGIAVSDFNKTAEMGWVNGYFWSKDGRLDEIIYDLGRWYNLDVSVAPDYKGKPVVLKIERNIPLDSVLDVLQKIGHNISIVDQKIVLKN